MLKRLMVLTTAAAAALCLATACGGDENGDDGGGGLAGGSFVMSLTAVDDQCFDGAVRAIVLPEGADHPEDLPEAVALPAMSELPTTISMKFNPPFSQDNEAEVEKDGEHGMRTKAPGVTNEDVDLYPPVGDGNDCFMDMTINVVIDVTDATTVTGTATLHITKAEGDCLEDITTKAAAGCDVTVTLRGAKQ